MSLYPRTLYTGTYLCTDVSLGHYRRPRLGEDIRGCWLPFLPFPFLTALFTLIAGIMVHPRPVLSH